LPHPRKFYFQNINYSTHNMFQGRTLEWSSAATNSCNIIQMALTCKKFCFVLNFFANVRRWPKPKSLFLKTFQNSKSRNRKRNGSVSGFGAWYWSRKCLPYHLCSMARFILSQHLHKQKRENTSLMGQ
jgi:hypothetical protein